MKKQREIEEEQKKIDQLQNDLLQMKSQFLDSVLSQDSKFRTRDKIKMKEMQEVKEKV